MPDYDKKGGGDTLFFVNKYKSANGSGVKTGDDSNMMLYLILALCAALTLTAAILLYIKKGGKKHADNKYGKK